MIEAAIVIPLVIIAVLTVGSVMKIAYCEERVSFITGNELAVLARDAYAEGERPFFPSEIERLTAEKMPELTNTEVTCYKYKFKDNAENIDSLILLEMSFEMKTGLPGGMAGGKKGKTACLLRAFCGRDNAAAVVNDEFQTDYDYEPVYLLPEYGSKYHTESCTYVNSYPVRTVMSDRIKRKYKACGKCGSKSAARGSVVYCFKYGDAYHTARCSTVTKYAICMDRHDAEIRGYTRCSKCGGTE